VTAPVYQFGEFRLDFGAFEILRNGQRLRVERKPMELLILLSSREGQLVTRAEIAQRLWSSEVFVDTEHGINTAIRKLRFLLRDDPENPQFIQTVTGMGYRFIAPITRVQFEGTMVPAEVPVPLRATPIQGELNAESVDGDSLDHPTTPAKPEIHSPARRWDRVMDSAQIHARETVGESGVAHHWPGLHRRALWLIGAAGLAVLVAGCSFLWLRWHAPKKAIASIAVLPFVNTDKDDDVEYLSDGMTSSLIGSLAHIPDLRVMARDTVFVYKGRQEDPRKIGRDLDVEAVVTGRVTRHADKLDIQIDLVNTTNNAELWGESYTRDRTEILAVQDDIAWDLSRQLSPQLSGEEKKQITRHYTENAEAYQLYLKGRYFTEKFDQEDFERGLGFYHQAIQLDPNYALAYAGLSYTYQLYGDVWKSPREIMPKAKEAARKSIELDDSLAEAHNELACVYFWYDWDLEAAGREYRRAVELDPNWAPIQMFDAWYLLEGAHFDEAIAKGRQAIKLDPLSPVILDNFVWVLIFSRRYDEALVRAQQALELHPDDWFAHAMLGVAYNQKGQPGLAIDDLQKANQIEANTQVLAELARAYFLADRKTEGRRVLSRLERQWQKSHVGAYNIATVYAVAQDKNQAMAWLDRAIDDRSFYLITLKVDPEMDSLHSDPRFRAVSSRF
jgi:TolB-like protein/DNA-binding winged helix-turn-helix (wHTH) protein/Tfp pilus assembly protein PilF